MACNLQEIQCLPQASVGIALRCAFLHSDTHRHDEEWNKFEEEEEEEAEEEEEKEKGEEKDRKEEEMWTALKKKEEDVAASGQRDSSVCKALSCKHKGLGSILRAHILKKISNCVGTYIIHREVERS